MKLHFSKSGPTVEGDAEHLGAEAGDAERQRAEDDGVLGLGLDADAVGALHVAAHDRPHHADEEDEAGGVADERVRLVDAAVEELEVSGSWWLISRVVVTASRIRNPK
jgi:hypothetical protein